MTKNYACDDFCRSRRALLRSGLYGLGAAVGLPYFLQEASFALAAEALLNKKEKHPNRILVVVELAGGNDGLNTVIPYSNDHYYRLRPTIGQSQDTIRKIDDNYGFHQSLEGFEHLFKDGKMAVVNGVGYPKPSLSHFTSMEYWHTGVPHGVDNRGWIGRLADAMQPEAKENLIVNIGTELSLACQSHVHAPIVFSDPERFQRLASDDQKQVFAELAKTSPRSKNPGLEFLHSISGTAAKSSAMVREACANYRTPVDYGPATGGGIAESMNRIAALIDAGFPTRFYYVNYSGFDTHVSQGSTHNLLLQYTADSVRGLMDDVQRLGRGDDVAIMMFSEFGRRPKENAGGGTDHGTAGPMFLFGNKVRGGLYGEYPSLTLLDENENFKMTTDFRRVYATMMKEWMGYDDTSALLKGEFETLGAVV